MVGQVLGNYRVLRQLGAGAMGVVYVARDERLEREVAIKVINTSSYDDDARKQRFLREARAVAALDHPNIGTLFGIEETPEGQMYMVMARYQGETLDARLRREGRIPVDAALDTALQVARGLEHAHQAGVIHRDIKPANLFLNRDGLVKILDFGTAKLIDGSRIYDDSASGTLAYMSPEQLEGVPVGAVSDLWAWGVVVFEMLTGLSPFHRVSGSARLFAALHETPDRLEPHLGPHPLRAQLQQLLDRTLSRDAARRYTTAGQLIAALAPLIGTGGFGVAGTAPRYQVPNNLSARRKPLWGREDELAHLARLLPDPAVQLVTLLGQGGVGKTHLAQQAAAAQLEQGTFPGGVYIAPLESLGGTSNVPAAIAEALSLSLSRQDAWEEVYSGLADRKLLLVLDNIEHLTALPGYLDTLLDRAPHLTLLVTSRERLNLVQERVVELHGLEAPTDPNDDFSAFAASQLFIQAAQKQAPGFVVDAAARPCVVALCRKLGGWPLGLELAAVWVRQLSCCDIVAEIEHNLDILSTRATNISARHRSARAVLEYSWQRLSDDERRVMRQVAVFHGG
ncbi:MAG: protein kinase [Trueperaceae bacterium]|nr:protein kinase [Trueperaceae bacterium]